MDRFVQSLHIDWPARAESLSLFMSISPNALEQRKRRQPMPPERAAALTALNAKLELAARQWRATADVIDDALVLIDSSDKILRMNRAAAASLGGSSWSVWVGKSSTRIAKYPPWNDALKLGQTALQRNSVVTGRAYNVESGRT